METQENKSSIVITDQDLSNFLKVPLTTIQFHCREGRYPFMKKIGRYWRGFLVKYEEWMKSEIVEGLSDKQIRKGAA